MAAACARSDPRPSEGFVQGVEGHQLYYRIFGTGVDTAIVLHGFQGNNQNYLALDLAPLISGRALLFYDQRGGGRSDPVSETELPGLEEHVADLEALRAALGLDRLRLIGHSGGAFIAIQYALDFPDRVDRIVLVSPGPPTPDYSEEVARAFYARLDSSSWADLNALQASLPTADDPATLCRRITATVLPRVWLADSVAVGRMRGDFCNAGDDVLRTEPQRLEAFRSSVASRDWTPDLPGIAHDVLVIHGGRDAIPVAAAEVWAATLPRASLIVIQGADHLPWVDQPHEFASALTGFLDAS